MNDSTAPSPSLTEEQAHQLLARAVALDAQHRDAVALVELRAAAIEAGIDPIAFDRAAAELGPDACVPTVRPPVTPSRWAPVAANLKAAFAFWVALTILTRLGHLLPPDWTVSAARNILAAGIGVWFAFRLRARVAQIALGGLSVALISLLVIHLIFGIDAAQGGPTYFAVLMAGLLGVAVAALSGTMTRRGRDSTPANGESARVLTRSADDLRPSTGSEGGESRSFRLVSVAAV
jgi:hypothetical protein